MERALFEVRTVLAPEISRNRSSFQFESIVRGHHVYKGAFNKNYFDNRIKPASNSEYALISEVRLTMHEYGILVNRERCANQGKCGIIRYAR